MNDVFLDVINPVLTTALQTVGLALFGYAWVFFKSSIAKIRQDQFGGGLSRAAGLVIDVYKNNPALSTAINYSSNAALDVGLAYLQRAYGGKGQLLDKLGNPSLEHLKEALKGEIAKIEAGTPSIMTPPAVVEPQDLTLAAEQAVKNVIASNVTPLQQAGN